MALSGLFLMLFLTQHFYQYDFGFSADTFNSLSHFMGNNPLVQFVIQPILIVGVIFHFIMGFVLDFKNRCKTNQIHKE
jgi:succinate dehydrogenase / fumarate reductase cytochrome b subunit